MSFINYLFTRKMIFSQTARRVLTRVLHSTFLLFLLSVSTKIFGQKNEIDSLKTQLALYPSDTSEVDLLNGLADNYRSIRIDSALYYANEALDRAEELGYSKGIAASYAHLGFIYFSSADDDQAYEHFLKALDLSTKIRDSVNLCLVYEGLGRFHDVMDQEDQALEMLKKSLTIADRFSLQQRKASILLSLSLLYESLGDEEKRLEYLNQSLELSEELDYTKGIINATNLLGSIYMEQEDYGAAMSNLQRALTLAKEQRNLRRASFALMRIGEIHMERGNYSDARQTLNQAVDIVRGTDLISYEQDATDKLYKLALKVGDYPKALQHFVRSSALLDSIYNRQTTNTISRLTTRYETEKKEQEIELQKQQITLLEQDREIKALWRNFLIVAILLVIIVAVLLLYLQRARSQRDQKFLNQKIEFQSKELASYTINFIQKRNLFETLEESLLEIEKAAEKDTSPKIRRIRQLVKQKDNIDKDWDEFKLYFENVHKDFFKVLKKKHPEISGTDLKLCALIKLNMNIKEMSAILGISPDSVKTARHRLRKKLNLEHEMNLHDYVSGVERSIY